MVKKLIGLGYSMENLEPRWARNQEMAWAGAAVAAGGSRGGGGRGGGRGQLGIGDNQWAGI